MSTDITPTGELIDGALVLTRTYRASVDDVWASVTDSERLARWFGTWTGDPADGFVMVKMNAEAEEVPATRYDITVCEPPHRLSIDGTDDYGRWLLDLELSEANGVTTFVLRQCEIDLGMAHDIGPGWEWYLDRQRAFITGATPPTLAEFEAQYRALGEHYRSLVERQDAKPRRRGN